jgi:hypothetical protein
MYLSGNKTKNINSFQSKKIEEQEYFQEYYPDFIYKRKKLPFGSFYPEFCVHQSYQSKLTYSSINQLARLQNSSSISSCLI